MAPITAIPRSIRPASSAVLYGVGTSGSPYNIGTSTGKNFFATWLKTYAASGDTRGVYMRLYFYGAGGGEAGRFYATASTTSVATGGTMNGVHASADIATSSGISGAANGLRATLGAAAASRTLTGTLASLQLDSDIGANNTLPGSHAFVRVTDSGSVRFTNFMIFPAAADGTIFAAHTTQTMTHSIKFVDAAGTAYYLMCTNAATNRS